MKIVTIYICKRKQEISNFAETLRKYYSQKTGIVVFVGRALINLLSKKVLCFLWTRKNQFQNTLRKIWYQVFENERCMGTHTCVFL